MWFYLTKTNAQLWVLHRPNVIISADSSWLLPSSKPLIGNLSFTCLVFLVLAGKSHRVLTKNFHNDVVLTIFLHQMRIDFMADFIYFIFHTKMPTFYFSISVFSVFPLYIEGSLAFNFLMKKKFHIKVVFPTFFFFKLYLILNICHSKSHRLFEVMDISRELRCLILVFITHLLTVRFFHDFYCQSHAKVVSFYSMWNWSVTDMN